MTKVTTYRSPLSQRLGNKKNIKSSRLTRPREMERKTTLKGRKLSFYMRVVTLKGPITKPIKKEVNIVTTVVTKI